jgi:WD repeat and FYVE domain-containing protein 3
MTAASVPSTLVKCLYLFFDLPEDGGSSSREEEDTPASAGTDNEFTPRERRILLQKMFMQVPVDR